MNPMVSLIVASALIAGALAQAASPGEFTAPGSASVKGSSSTTYEGKRDGKRGELSVTAVGDSSAAAEESDGPTDRYIRADGFTCTLFRGLDLAQYDRFLESCPEGAVTVADDDTDCDPGAVELAALWVERLDGEGGYLPGELVEEGSCVSPGDVAAEAEEAFAALQVTTPRATIQAARPLLVNVHYPVQANAEPLQQQFTLLGVPVLIRAEPAEYLWDFDDPHTPGTATLTTTKPGTRWIEGTTRPDATWIGHTYTHLGHPDTDPGTHVDTEGDWYRDDVTITLTTTWTGRYQLVGTSTWTPIDGTLTTTSTIDPLTVTEARVRLVCSDLNGHRTC